MTVRGDQPFKDLADFAHRINPRALNKRVLESLAAAGAFDTIEPNRTRVFAAVDTLLATAQRTHDVVPANSRQADVEHEQIAARACVPQRGVTVGSAHHGVSFALEMVCD